ncbi:uncharacterized protein VTP21DRAFT_5855 [Calcarisporiella thermophila]|uniref:uncharacterized protein n=1 Tax=Calcarisporiella thermophila TaxID=911321 RepID=UPI0037441F0E
MTIKPPHKKKNRSTEARKSKREAELQELRDLEEKCKDPSTLVDLKQFSELPISPKTLNGLSKSNFVEMTDIQRKAIPLALANRDVLGAAKTGSGKTIAFLVPMLEILYRANWTQMDGLGALIISPTRELAVQIFEVLRKIGRFHAFSAGLIIGGKDVKSEQERVNRMNILVCTPGRLLQHMDQTAGFDCTNLQLLILDEADRILDMGFEKSVNAIIENLPPRRQTLLFSATQTKSVRDLARLSLKDPEYVAVHEKHEYSTPQTLKQHYLVSELPDKLDILYSFMKSHLKVKALVFLSSCKQVRFIFETFCKLQPGVPLLHLHGKQKQTRRVEIFERFSKMQHAYLFATDIAARGLDFPAVDWVLQVDAPEDAETYIHRVGRTARYEASGQALLFLLPSEEEGMVSALEKKKVPIAKIKVRPNKKMSIRNQMQKFCFQDPEIKYLGQKAFVSYMRSVHLQRDKSIFNVEALPAEEYAFSLGLPGAPKIKFIKKSQAKNAVRAQPKPIPGAESESESQSESEAESAEEAEPEVKKQVKTKVDRMFGRKNQGVLSEHYEKLVDRGEDAKAQGGEEDDDDFMTLKRVDHELESDGEKEENIPMSKRQLKMTKKEKVKKMSKGEKLLFDEEGRPHAVYEFEDEKSFLKSGQASDQKRAFLAKTLEAMQQADVEDKLTAKEKRKQKRLAKKLREREMRGEDAGAMVTLASPESDFEDAEEHGDDYSEDEGTQEKSNGKRWFQQDSDESSGEEEVEAKGRKKRKVIEVEQPETLEDQEALALRLLGGN